MEIVGYHSRINITQVLPWANGNITRALEIGRNRLICTSWLYDNGISKIIDLFGYRLSKRRRLKRAFKNMKPKI